MNCCGCAPLAVETIYNKVDELEKKGLIPSYICASTRNKLLEFSAFQNPNWLQFLVFQIRTISALSPFL